MMLFPGYQVVAFTPETVKFFTSLLPSKRKAVKFIKRRGALMDACWAIVGLENLFDYAGVPASAGLIRVFNMAIGNLDGTSFYFKDNYLHDRNPLPTDQDGGYSAVMVKWEAGKDPELTSNVWCVSKQEAMQYLRLMKAADCDSLKAIVYSPSEIYDQNGERASTQLYEFVTGIKRAPPIYCVD